jgi:probable rRNA maturation factor
MDLIIANHSEIAFPRKWVKQVMSFIAKQSSGKLSKTLKHQEVTIVFLNPTEAKKLNRIFRKKNYATDILSFASAGERSLGELVICPQMLKKQAKEHKHSFKAELAYMLIHGVLHLMGHEHEGGTASAKRKAKLMFALQDQVFDRLCKKYHF